MGQRPIEIILMRQLASYLAVPILIVDRNLDLLFFNESAEPILGRRFDETGEIRRGEWSALLRPMDEQGNPIPRDEQPLALAIDRNEPSHRRSWTTGLDGIERVIEGLAFPLETREEGLIGAAGIFWQVRESNDPPPTLISPGQLSRSVHEVEVVLLRRLAERLTIPMFVVDGDGKLLFYNPAAEPLLGRPYSDVGSVEVRELYEAFSPSEENGSRIKWEDFPMLIALERLEPSHRRFEYQGLDGVKRCVEGTALPLVGQCDRHLGAVGIFWERSK